MTRLFRFSMEEGIDPLMRLSDKVRDRREVRSPMDDGIGPEIELDERSKVVRLTRLPTEGEMVPFRPI
jgi:hypothetical protein